MSEGQKIIAILSLAVCYCVTLLVMPESTNLLWSVFAALCSAIGLPIAGAGVKAISRGLREG